MPAVSPVTHAGVTLRAVPTRNGWLELMLLALKTYVVPATSVAGRLGV